MTLNIGKSKRLPTYNKGERMLKPNSKIFSPAVFLTSYLILLAATYILPYFGSNAWALAEAARRTNHSTSFFYFWFSVHALTYVGMGFLAYSAGKISNKTWLVVFPVIGAIFDLAPTLNMIPILSSILNIVGLVMSFKAVTAFKDQEIHIDRPVRIDEAA